MTKLQLRLRQESVPTPLWQSPLWEEFQKTRNASVWRLTVKGASALVLHHKLPLGLCWLEVPRGPVCENAKGETAILNELFRLARQEKAVFVRLSPYHTFSAKLPNLRPSGIDVHPETSLILDLEKTPQELMAQMKQKGRYNIRLAEKNGVTVEESTDVETFYGLLQQTGTRDGFGIHPKSHYRSLLETFGPNAWLLLASHQGTVVAGGLFIGHAGTAFYYYGASSHAHRALMAPYAVQWQAILEAKKRHLTRYDFLGIAPPEAVNHPWAGVTEFKLKFGGMVETYPPAQDLVVRPFWYAMYRWMKRLRK